MTEYATGQRLRDGDVVTIVNIEPADPEMLAYLMTVSRSEWVMAPVEGRGGFPVALRRDGDEWVECETEFPYSPVKQWGSL